MAWRGDSRDRRGGPPRGEKIYLPSGGYQYAGGRERDGRRDGRNQGRREHFRFDSPPKDIGQTNS